MSQRWIQDPADSQSSTVRFHMVPALQLATVLQLSLTDEAHMCFTHQISHKQVKAAVYWRFHASLIGGSVSVTGTIMANYARLNAKQHTRQLKCQCVHLKRWLPAQLNTVCWVQPDFLHKSTFCSKLMAWNFLTCSFWMMKYLKKQKDAEHRGRHRSIPPELMNAAEKEEKTCLHFQSHSKSNHMHYTKTAFNTILTSVQFTPVRGTLVLPIFTLCVHYFFFLPFFTCMSKK